MKKEKINYKEIKADKIIEASRVMTTEQLNKCDKIISEATEKNENELREEVLTEMVCDIAKLFGKEDITKNAKKEISRLLCPAKFDIFDIADGPVIHLPILSQVFAPLIGASVLGVYAVYKEKKDKEAKGLTEAAGWIVAVDVARECRKKDAAEN